MDFYSTFKSTNTNLSRSATLQDSLLVLARVYLNVLRFLYEVLLKDILSLGGGGGLNNKSLLIICVVTQTQLDMLHTLLPMFISFLRLPSMTVPIKSV